MPRKKGSIKNKIKKNERMRKIHVRRRLLNLPDSIWQAYKSTQQSTEKNEIHFNTKQSVNVVDEENNQSVSIKNNLNAINEKSIPVTHTKNILNDVNEENKSPILNTKESINVVDEENKLPVDNQNNLNTVSEKSVPFTHTKSSLDVINEENKSLILNINSLNVDEEDKSPIYTKNCLNFVNEKKKSRNVIDEEKLTILRKLAVNLDNYLVFPNNWDALTKKLNQCIETHKSIYKNLINAKKNLVFCSHRTGSQTNDEDNNHIIAADTQLEGIIKTMHNQEDTLLNFKNILYEVALPLQIMSPPFFEPKDLVNEERLLHKKKIEEKDNFFQTQLQNCTDKLHRTKISFQKCVQEKNKIISQLKLKLYSMKKRFMQIHKTRRREKEINVDPKENQIQQLKTLIDLSHSMMQTILENKSSSTDSVDQKDSAIKVLKLQIQKLKDQNKQTDKINKRLLKAAEEAKKEKLEMEEKIKKIQKEKDLKTYQLMSELNALKRKHDRWLADRYYQKLHSAMLFNKMKQMEKSQTTFLNVKKLECKKDEKPI